MNNLEVWQRGPIEGVPPLLQPVAHAILQVSEEVDSNLADFPVSLLWMKPAGVASVGFHLQHMTGVLDRLFTYARGEVLTATQLEALSTEGKGSDNIDVAFLIDRLKQQVNKSIEQLKVTDEQTLLDRRGIGRKQIPTNVLGLLFHAAEHTQRHLGQLIVTARILQDEIRSEH